MSAPQSSTTAQDRVPSTREQLAPAVGDSDAVFGIVPDALGVTVVAVGDLTERLDAGEPLDEALSNSGIDSQRHCDKELVERVRQLNLTGDAAAYWGRK